MTDLLPLGKLDKTILSPLLKKYTHTDEKITVGAKIGEDAAVLDYGDRYLIIKTNPITFTTQDLGWYVVHVCVNNVVVRGAQPRWMLNCLLLPEQRTTAVLAEEIFDQIYKAAEEFQLQIIGGHTEVTVGLTRPIVVGTLIGEAKKGALITTSGVKEGDRIFVSKSIGIEGTAIIAKEKEKFLLERGYTQSTIEKAKTFLFKPGISVFHEATLAAQNHVVNAMTDVTEGGLASALHELADAAGVGIAIHREKIPIQPETVHLCAEFGIDPIGLISSGMLLMTAPDSNSVVLMQRMEEYSIPCVEIGRVTNQKDGRKISIGGELQDLPYFPNDEITKIYS